LKSGAFFSDKTGDIKFIALDNLVKPEEQEEEVKEEEEDLGIHGKAKQLMGHQQTVNLMRLSWEGDHLVSVDKMRNIRVSRFPNVFVIDRVISEHKT